MRDKANIFWGGVRKPQDALFLNSLNLFLNAQNAAEIRVTSHCWGPPCSFMLWCSTLVNCSRGELSPLSYTPGLGFLSYCSLDLAQGSPFSTDINKILAYVPFDKDIQDWILRTFFSAVLGDGCSQMKKFSPCNRFSGLFEDQVQCPACEPLFSYGPHSPSGRWVPLGSMYCTETRTPSDNIDQKETFSSLVPPLICLQDKIYGG